MYTGTTISEPAGEYVYKERTKRRKHSVMGTTGCFNILVNLNKYLKAPMNGWVE